MTVITVKKAVTMLTAAVVTMSASGLFTSAIAAPVGATNSVGEAAAQTAELDKVLTGTGGAVEVFNRSITAGRSVAVLSVGSEYPRLSEHVVDVITAKLSSGGRYKMVGRPALDAAAKQAFPKGMTVDDQTARWLCKTAGAQTVLVGTILPQAADKAERAAFFNLEIKVLDVNSDRPVDRFSRKIKRGALEGLLGGDGAVAAVDGTATAAKAQVAAAAQKAAVADVAAGKNWGDESGGDIVSDDEIVLSYDPTDDLTPTPASVISSAGKVVVGPLLKTQWGGHSSPIFNTLPDGQVGWIDCGNVAEAQIMKYHNYPKRGNGQSVPCNPCGFPGNKEVVMPSVSFEVDYDWNNMLDTYNKNVDVTERHRNSALTLLHHVSLGRFSGRIASLVSHFGYDKSIQRHARKYHNDSAWVAMIREQLDSGLPIWYYGEGSGTHAFVIDGYDNKGKYHVNWGLGGGNEGYYSIDSLRGWVRAQYMIINIKPDKGSVGSHVMALDSFAVGKTSVGQYELFSIAARIISLGFFTGGHEGTALVDNNGNIAKVVGIKKFDALDAGKARNYKFDAFIGDDVKPGQYSLRIVTKLEGEGWKIATLSDRIANIPTAINFTINATEQEANGGGYGLALSEFSTEKNSVLVNEAFKVTMKVKNFGEEKYPGGQFGAALIDKGGNIVEVIGSPNVKELGIGSNRRLIFTCKVPNTVSPGQYRLRIVIKPNGKDEWRVATMAIDGTTTAIDFTVNR